MDASFRGNFGIFQTTTRSLPFSYIQPNIRRKFVFNLNLWLPGLRLTSFDITYPIFQSVEWELCVANSCQVISVLTSCKWCTNCSQPAEWVCWEGGGRGLVWVMLGEGLKCATILYAVWPCKQSRAVLWEYITMAASVVWHGNFNTNPKSLILKLYWAQRYCLANSRCLFHLVDWLIEIRGTAWSNLACLLGLIDWVEVPTLPPLMGYVCNWLFECVLTNVWVIMIVENDWMELRLLRCKFWWLITVDK